MSDDLIEKLIHDGQLLKRAEIGAGVLSVMQVSECEQHIHEAIEALSAARSQGKAEGMGSRAAADVLAERERQKTVEGWTEAHDDAHSSEELARAAACYAAPPWVRNVPFTDGDNILDRLWPWDRQWWKPTQRRRSLVKAGALILAEIERLDRAAATPEPHHDAS